MTLKGSGRGRCHDRVDNTATSQENLARIEPEVEEGIITNSQINKSNMGIF